MIISFESAELTQRHNIAHAVEIARGCGGQIGDDEIRVDDGTGAPTGRGGAVGAWRNAFIGVHNGVETSLGLIAGGIDGVGAVFDDGSLVADGGLLLAGTLMARLGLEALIDEVVRPAGAGRGSGAKVLSVVASMLVGGSCIDDANRLLGGRGVGLRAVGAVDAGELSAVFHVRSCAPARPRS